MAEGVVLPPSITSPDGCLRPTDVIDSNHPAVLAKAATVSGTPMEKAQALFAMVRDQYRYDFTPKLVSRDSWRASQTLERGKGFCQQKAVLLAALLRAAGVPSAICFQHIRDHKLLDTRFAAVLPDGIIAFHGLAAVWSGTQWLRLDPSLDKGLVEIRRYRLTEFDGTHEALLNPNDLDGHPHFDFLAHLGPFADFPRVITDVGVEIRAVWDALRDVAKKTNATM